MKYDLDVGGVIGPCQSQSLRLKSLEAGVYP